MRKIFLFIFFFWLASFRGHVFAQETGAGIANYIPVAGDGAVMGKIVSFGEPGYALSSKEYDEKIYGVISDSAPIAFKSGFSGQSNLKRVITVGKAVVMVSAAGGEIKPGDLITSSGTAGVGQKANQYGYVLGMAMEGFKGGSGSETGQIVVSVNIHPNLQASSLKTNLLEALRLGVSAPFLSPVVSLRYLIAALIVLVAFAFGFMFFGRSTTKGIEALGRNPLASRVIAASMVFNLLLTLGVIMVGLGLAYLILTL